MPKPVKTARPAGAGAIAEEQLAHMNDWSIPVTPQEKKDWAWEHPIYIFNVGPDRWQRDMGGIGPFVIQACPKGQRYSEPTIIPRIFQETIPVDMRKMEIRDISGLELAQNIVGIAQQQPKAQAYDQYGVFISHSDPPLIEEVEAANAKLLEHYHKLVVAADEFYNAGPIQHINITARHREALKATNQKRPWGVASVEMEVCPGCQESINPGVVVHTCGAVLNWDKAIELGIRKASDRPEK